MTATAPDKATLGATIHRIHEEAAGAMLVEITRREDLPELIGSAVANDPESYRVLRMVNEALRHIQNAPRRKRGATSAPAAGRRANPSRRPSPSA